MVFSSPELCPKPIQYLHVLNFWNQFIFIFIPCWKNSLRPGIKFIRRLTFKNSYSKVSHRCCVFCFAFCILGHLPFSIRVLLEAAIRNCDQFLVKENDIENILNWNVMQHQNIEVPFKPARVILQDFTWAWCHFSLLLWLPCQTIESFLKSACTHAHMMTMSFITQYLDTFENGRGSSSEAATDCLRQIRICDHSTFSSGQGHSLALVMESMVLSILAKGERWSCLGMSRPPRPVIQWARFHWCD